MELLISVGFRSLRYSLFEAPPHKWLVLAIFWELLLFAVLIHVPAVRETFGVRMPTWNDAGLVLGVGAVVLAAIELAKAYLRITTPEEPAVILKGGNAMQKILVPVDGSPNSQFAVRHLVRQFMNDTTIELHLLNVQPPFSSYVARFVPKRNLNDYHRENAEAALQPVRQILDGFSVPYAVHTDVGDRAECITAAARRLRCDLIVMSAARKNSLTRLLQNSTTNRVLELTPVPVEVIAGEAVSPWERYGLPASIGALIALLLAAVAD